MPISQQIGCVELNDRDRDTVDNQAYFRLHGTCAWVLGKSRGAVYDLMRWQLFWIKEHALARGMDNAITGLKLSDAAAKVGIREQDLRELCIALVALGYGRFSHHCDYVEQFHPYIFKNQIRELEMLQPLYRATFQITDHCSYDCKFCGFEQGISTALCTCGRWPADHPFAGEALTETLDHLITLGCQRLDILGGDPFRVRDRLWPLVQRARSGGMSVFIHAPAFRITESDLKQLCTLGVNLVVPVFSDEAHTFDAISGKKGSFDALERILERLKDVESSSVIAKAILVPETDGALPNLKGWLSRMGVQHIMVEHFRPFSLVGADPSTGRCALDGLLKTSTAKFVPEFAQFFQLREGHPCFRGNLTVTLDGRLLPCIAASESTVADLTKTSFLDVMRNNLMEPYWYEGPDRKEGCLSCEFRYACVECSLQTQRLRPMGQGRSWNCLYDPNTGRWDVEATWLKTDHLGSAATEPSKR